MRRELRILHITLRLTMEDNQVCIRLDRERKKVPSNIDLANQLRWCYACSCFHDNPGCPEAYDHPYHVQGAAGIEGYVQSQYSAPAPALSPGFMGGASTSSFVLSSVAASVPSSSCVQSHEGVGYTPQGRPMADAGRNTRPLAPAPPTESAAEGLGGPTVGLYTKIPPKGRGGKREKQRKG